MQPHGWKSLVITVLLVIFGVSSYSIRGNAAIGKKSNTTIRQELDVDTENRLEICPNNESNIICEQLPQSELWDVIFIKQNQLDLTNPKLLISQTIPAQSENRDSESNSTSTQVPDVITETNEPPQLETQPSDFPGTSPKPIEQLLDSPPQNNNERAERLERLRRRLRDMNQSSSEPETYRELGLRVRRKPLSSAPLEQPQPPQIERPIPKFQPIGFLQARVGYFLTNNIFSAEDIPIEDGLFFYGLRLSSAYFPLGRKTFINGAIEGNLIRYVDQSKFNYNQLRFNLGIYQQLSRRMFGEISWSNQQLFYANSSDVFTSGDRFLNEHSLRLSLGRRDPLTESLTLDSVYEFSWNLADPDSRSRLINSLWLSLNYKLQKPLEVGLNYQLSISDFTERDRHDQSHRIFTHLSYRLSKSSRMNIQSGFTFGDSTARNIDFDNWFFSVNYNLLLGEF